MSHTMPAYGPWTPAVVNSAVFIKHHAARDLSAVASLVASPTGWARSESTVCTP
jgi:hypothetical protein